ncbi:zeta toxin family protein [Paenibacillus provencensis]|uniref:UDP-N-acetylglucosamine kinase n=1 Tax=Paenibacillus provencensis TaxID=441151 RepID=A0ABW3Q6W3_9BACL
MEMERLQRLLTPESSPTMTVFAGTNGAGKSHLTRILDHKNKGIETIDADAIAKDMNISNIAAGREAVKRVRDCISNGRDFSIETTLGGKNVLRQMEMAKNAGFQVDLYYVGLKNVDMHLLRVKNRVEKGGHDIPAEDIIRRYVTSQQNLPQAMRLADRSFIFDNTHVYQLQAEVNRGKTTYQAPPNEMEPWVKSVMKEWSKSLGEVKKDLEANRDTLSKELQQRRQELHSAEQPLHNFKKLEKLEGELKELNQKIEAKQAKNMKEKITQPNKKELLILEEKRQIVNGEVMEMKAKSPSPSEIQGIQQNVSSLTSIVRALDRAVKETTKQITSVHNDILKRDMQNTYRHTNQQQMSQQSGLEL